MVNKTGNQVYSNVGKATGKGIIDRFKDAGGLGKGFTKALGPLGAGLSYYSNYHDAQADGVKGKKAHSRAVVDTTIDTAVGAGVKAGSDALFTEVVAYPGVVIEIDVDVGVV